MEGAVRDIRGYIRLARGDHVGGLADLERNLALARDVMDPQGCPSPPAAARGLALVGRMHEARTLAVEGLAFVRKHLDLGIRGPNCRIREAARDPRRNSRSSSWRPTIWKEPRLAGATGDLIPAADIFDEFGAVAIEADQRFAARN